MKFLCPNGHEWEISSEQFAKDGKNIVECPVCHREPLQDLGANTLQGLAAVKLLLATTASGALAGWLLTVSFHRISESFGEHPLSQLMTVFFSEFFGWLASLIPGAILGCLVGLTYWRYGRSTHPTRPPNVVLECVAIFGSVGVLCGTLLFLTISIQAVSSPPEGGLSIVVCLVAAATSNFVAASTCSLPKTNPIHGTFSPKPLRTIMGSIVGGALTVIGYLTLAVLEDIRSNHAPELVETAIVFTIASFIGMVLGASMGLVRMTYEKKHPSHQISLVAASLWAISVATLISLLVRLVFVISDFSEAIVFTPMLMILVGANLGAALATLVGRRKSLNTRPKPTSAHA